MLQLVRQSSLGGLFYLLGERPLSISLPNIAKLNFGSLTLLRPYSTFSHPNSLAGYLLIVYIILNLISKSKLLKLFISAIIVLSFSKAAIIALVFIEIFQLNALQSLLVSALISFTPFTKTIVSLPGWLLPSFSSRYYLLLPTLKIVINRWLTGTGLRQFVPKLGEILPHNQISFFTLQPVHNTFLLMLAEIGILGIILIIKVLYDIFVPLFKSKETRGYAKKILGVVLITSSLDHYWWTLPQNQLIIILALALLSNMTNKSKLSN
ncbi:hypothetical protein HY008_03590 [Candidatus Woesebacteria bacterium]|nr:hypothetical protein [Candidatus Woesebacteria bacterium]